MPVQFTIDLPTADEAEARRLVSIITDLPCDTHGKAPTSVRLTSPAHDARSVTVKGCCPQLYLDVIDRLSKETDVSRSGTSGEGPVAEPPRLPRRPPAV